MLCSISVIGISIISTSCSNESISTFNMKNQAGEEYKSPDNDKADNNKLDNEKYNLAKKLSVFSQFMFYDVKKEGPNKESYEKILASVLQEYKDPIQAYLNLAENLTKHFDSSKTGVTLPRHENHSYGKSFPTRGNFAVCKVIELLKGLVASNKNSTILREYGSGYGFSTAKIVGDLPSKIIENIKFEIGDINPKICDYLAKLKEDIIMPSKPNVVIGITENNDITAKIKSNCMKYDVILALNVLHYISPDKWDDVFDNLNYSLKNNGKVVLSVDYPFSGDPNLDTSRTVYDKHVEMAVEWPGLKINAILSTALGEKYTNLPYYIFFKEIMHKPGDYLVEEDFSNVSKKINSLPLGIKATKLSIPALCFTKKDFERKLAKYNKIFNLISNILIMFHFVGLNS